MRYKGIIFGLDGVICSTDNITIRRGRPSFSDLIKCRDWRGGGALPSGLRLKGRPPLKNPVFGVRYGVMSPAASRLSLPSPQT